MVYNILWYRQISFYFIIRIIKNEFLPRYFLLDKQQFQNHLHQYQKDFSEPLQPIINKYIKNRCITKTTTWIHLGYLFVCQQIALYSFIVTWQCNNLLRYWLIFKDPIESRYRVHGMGHFPSSSIILL